MIPTGGSQKYDGGAARLPDQKEELPKNEELPQNKGLDFSGHEFEVKPLSLETVSSRIDSLKQLMSSGSIKTMDYTGRHSLEKSLKNIKGDLKAIQNSHTFSIGERLIAAVKFIAVKFLMEGRIKSQIAEADRKEDKAIWNVVNEEAKAHTQMIDAAKGKAHLEVWKLLQFGAGEEKVKGYIDGLVHDKASRPEVRIAKIEVLQGRLENNLKEPSSDKETVNMLIMDCRKAYSNVWDTFANEIRDELSSVFDENNTNEDVLSKIEELKNRAINSEGKTRDSVKAVIRECDDAFALVKETAADKEEYLESTSSRPEQKDWKQAHIDSELRNKLSEKLPDAMRALVNVDPEKSRSERKKELVLTKDALQNELSAIKNTPLYFKRNVEGVIDSYNEEIDLLDAEINRATAMTLTRVKEEFRNTEQSFNDKLVVLIEVLQKVSDREDGKPGSTIVEMQKTFSIVQQKGESLIQKHLSQNPPNLSGFVNDPEFTEYTNAIKTIAANFKDYNKKLDKYLNKSKNEGFSTEVTELMQGKGAGVSVSALTITPIQRIPRLVLLINEAMKHEPNTQELNTLEESLNVVKEKALEINAIK